MLTWLVEVGAEGESDAEGSEGESGRGTARLSWSARVSAAPTTTASTEEPPHEHRVNTRLDIEKDDIQAVLPISKVGFFNKFVFILQHNIIFYKTISATFSYSLNASHIDVTFHAHGE